MAAIDRFSDPEPTEFEALQSQVVALREQLESSSEEHQIQLEESIRNLDQYLDSRGWTSLYGVTESEGPELEQLHDASRRIREMVAMNSWVKNGLKLRTHYVWDGGIHYDDSRIPSGGRGRAVNVRDRMDKAVNKRNFFSQAARELRESALYCDSQVFYVGDDLDYTIRPVGITEITADYRNPDFSDEIWAYRRSWKTFPPGDKTGVVQNEWIFVNAFFDKRIDTIEYGGKREAVSRTKRMFGRAVNGQIGWPYGVPDALGGMAWAEQMRQFLISGKKMSDAMAKIWASAKVNTPAGGGNAAAKIGNATDGNTAIMGVGNSLQPMSTAGQSYDFAKGLPIIAAFAAYLGISAIELTANPGSAGASYGSAKALDISTQKMTKARREFHIDIDREVLEWLGAPTDLDIWFDSLLDEDQKYRQDQRIALRGGTGLFDGKQFKEMFALADGRKSLGDVPTGWMLPNNEKSLARKDIDSDGASQVANGGDFTSTQGSPAALTGGGSGDQNASDLRTDTISG